MKFKRVAIDGPGDDPDEYWFECNECKGSGVVRFPDVENEEFFEEGECPNCAGLGAIEGDAYDV